jgi:hypothetical protein
MVVNSEHLPHIIVLENIEILPRHLVKELMNQSTSADAIYLKNDYVSPLRQKFDRIFDQLLRSQNCDPSIIKFRSKKLCDFIIEQDPFMDAVSLDEFSQAVFDISNPARFIFEKTSSEFKSALMTDVKKYGPKKVLKIVNILGYTSCQFFTEDSTFFLI